MATDHSLTWFWGLPVLGGSGYAAPPVSIKTPHFFSKVVVGQGDLLFSQM